MKLETQAAKKVKTLQNPSYQSGHAKTEFSILSASNKPDDSLEMNSANLLKGAINNTIITFIATAIFGISTFFMKGEQSALEFFTGFLVEKSLSIDNLFVFIMLFDYFKVPISSQGRVLTWGLIGAVIMRGFMIMVGVTAIHKFRWISLLFAAILIGSSYKLFFEESDQDSHDLSENFMLKLTQRFIKTSTKFNGNNFFTEENGKKIATPLLACLISVELSDFIFAVDSIPAVLGISHDPFIVYTSNIFAILGMRSLYIIISSVVSTLKYLRPSVAIVLAFVGSKLIGEYFHYQVSPNLSLIIIFSIISGGLIASIVHKSLQSKMKLNLPQTI